MKYKTNHWSAFHIFLTDPIQLESFINHWLSHKAKSIIQSGQAKQWFFIRYWDGGPHVRVRFLELEDEDLLLNELSNAAQSYLAETPTSAHEYYQGHSFDGQPVNTEQLHWYGDGAVRKFDYQPEIQRYGGEKAININEQLFNHSSDLALAIIKNTENNIDKRIQISLALLVNSFLAFDLSIERLAQFCDNYAKFWQSHTANAQYQNNTDAAKDELFNAILRIQNDLEADTTKGISSLWVSKIQQAIRHFFQLYQDRQLISPITGQKVATESDYQYAVISMLGSQIHMLNNRIGVTPPYEYAISRMILDAINFAQEKVS